MIPVGSNFLVSMVERAVTPKPCDHNVSEAEHFHHLASTRLTNGVSDMLKTTTP
jgi:hypothetical protein